MTFEQALAHRDAVIPFDRPEEVRGAASADGLYSAIRTPYRTSIKRWEETATERIGTTLVGDIPPEVYAREWIPFMLTNMPTREQRRKPQRLIDWDGKERTTKDLFDETGPVIVLNVPRVPRSRVA